MVTDKAHAEGVKDLVGQDQGAGRRRARSHREFPQTLGHV